MPTSEELKYFIAMKDVIAGKMGEWQWHDGWHDPEDGATGKVVPGQVKFFRDPGDEMHNFVRLPLPIDPENPERGLWGMIDWKRWAISLDIDGSMVLDDMDDASEANRYSTGWDTPTLALLKALAWQEGIEVTP